MKKYLFLIAFCSVLLALPSCTDVIDVETDPADTLLVVDGWLTDEAGPQTIRLTQSQPYFDNELADGVTGAVVSVETNTGEKFSFLEEANGNYVWTPTGNETLGGPGTSYTLTIETDGQTYVGQTVFAAAPPVDSITQEFREDDLSGPDGIYTQFFARDLPGLGNTYWIKTYKNGELLNKPSELNLAYDAAFAAGSPVDGLIFIPPIREATNRIASEDDPDTDDAPWAVGDQIRVEIHGISLTAFDFLFLAREQMTNGDNTIFAVPLANTDGNVENVSGGRDALGIFNVGQVTAREKNIE